MKKQVLTLIALVAAVAACAAVLVVVLHMKAPVPTDNQTQKNETAEKTQMQTLIDRHPETLLSVTCTNKTGGFSLCRGDNKRLTLQQEQVSRLPVDQKLLDAIASAGTSLHALRMVAESTENPAAFGLKPAQGKAVLKYDDGQEAAILVGNQAPDGSGRYCTLEQKTEVYIVPFREIDWILMGECDLMSKNIPAPTDDAVYDKIILGGSNRPREIVLVPTDQHVYSASAYEIIAPRERVLNDLQGEKLMLSLCQMTAKRIKALNPDETMLSDCGLNSPYSTVTLQGISTQRYFASKPRDGICYVYREDIPVIYEVSSENLAWLEYQVEDLALQLIVMPHINDLQRIRLAGQEKTYEILLHGTGDDQRVSVNGQTVSTEVFKKFYQALLALPAVISYEEPQTSAKEILTVVYEFKGNAKEQIEIKLLDLDGRYAQVWKNGQMDSVTKSAHVEIILQNCIKLLEGDNITFPYP